MAMLLRIPIIIFVFLTVVLQGQNSPLQQAVNLPAQESTLKDFLAQISEAYTIDFAYSDNLLPNQTLAIPKYDKVSLSTIMEELLHPYNLSHKQVGQQVVIYALPPQKKVCYVSGYLTDKQTGEALIGATVFIHSLQKGVVSNAYGYYSLKIPDGTYLMHFACLGYTGIKQELKVTTNSVINIELPSSKVHLDEVIITHSDSQADGSFIASDMTSLNSQTLKRIPGLFGESDVTRTLSILPGINQNELSSGSIYVRGGSADQTLFLMDEGKIFDASHFGGFFSIFNPDIVNHVKVYKADMPSNQQGAISSLIDVLLREGNSKKWRMSGGIGLIDAKATLEGPLKKDHSSMLVSFRRTYIDGLINLVETEFDPTGFNFYFYDFNLKVNSRVNTKNHLFLSAYMGKDFVRFFSDMQRKNHMINFRWNRIFGPRLFLKTSAVISGNTVSQITLWDMQNLLWYQDIRETELKSQLKYYLSSQTTVSAGGSHSVLDIQPFNFIPAGEHSMFRDYKGAAEQLQTSSLYLAVRSSMGNKWHIDAGCKLNRFFNPYANRHLGPENYRQAKTGNQNNHFSKLYYSPRVQLNYHINAHNKLQLAYNHLVNPLHQFRLNTIGIAINRWLPASPGYLPQSSNNYSLGYSTQSIQGITFTTEGYYRKLNNLYESLFDSRLLDSESPDAYVREAEGYAYGIELAALVEYKRFVGMYSYEYAEVFWKSAGVMNEAYYPASHSRPHVINLSNTIDVRKRLSVSLNWQFSSGLPFTPVAGVYRSEGRDMLYLDENRINSRRLPAYHRMDISVDLAGKKNQQRRWKQFWNFSVYNVYARRNALGISYFTTQPNDPEANIELKPRYLFLYQFVPSISYRFEF